MICKDRQRFGAGVGRNGHQSCIEWVEVFGLHPFEPREGPCMVIKVRGAMTSEKTTKKLGSCD